MQEPSSFAQWEEAFSKLTFLDCLSNVSNQFSGVPALALMALRERFIDFAFEDPGLPFRDRVISCYFARTLEEIIVVFIHQDHERLRAFTSARNSSMDVALSTGFGTVNWITRAWSHPDPTLDAVRRLESISQIVEALAERRAHLASIAFERTSDA